MSNSQNEKSILRQLRIATIRDWLLLVFDRISANFWIIPAVMAVGAALLAFGAIRFDRAFQESLRSEFPLLFVNSVDGSRALLSTIAGSMISVAGTVFSLTMVVLSLSSQQHGPLTLENFLRDRGNQIVLGTFTGTFIYSLLVLRVISGEEDAMFLPAIASLIGVILAMTSLAVLIYFIHHISYEIQAVNIITSTGNALMSVIKVRYPDLRPPEREELALPPAEYPYTHRMTLHSNNAGYIQLINVDALLDLAINKQMRIQIDRRTGDFLLPGGEIGQIYSNGAIDEGMNDAVVDEIILGRRRTQASDVDYVITQLVSIAIRALSPGINDPTTAILCIDQLGRALLELSNRDLTLNYEYEPSPEIGVYFSQTTYREYLETMFEQIRHYGASDPTIAIQLLKTIGKTATQIEDPIREQTLREYAEWVLADAERRTETIWPPDRIEREFNIFWPQEKYDIRS